MGEGRTLSHAFSPARPECCSLLPLVSGVQEMNRGMGATSGLRPRFSDSLPAHIRSGAVMPIRLSTLASTVCAALTSFSRAWLSAASSLTTRHSV
jgi:hypothetical protein